MTVMVLKKVNKKIKYIKKCGTHSKKHNVWFQNFLHLKLYKKCNYYFDKPVNLLSTSNVILKSVTFKWTYISVFLIPGQNKNFNFLNNIITDRISI